MFFISRVIFTMMFWVVLARWGYSEIAQASPSLKVSVDKLIEMTTIPTHDHWDMKKVKGVAEQIVENFGVEKAFAGQKD